VRDVFSSGPPASAETTLAALFGAQVARTPEAVALLAGREQLTYAELDAESNKLAREIIALGFGPGDVAALLLPRASRLIVALLACVKTGIAYCPLDPTNPGERLDYMIAASGSKFVIRDLAGPLDVGRDLATLYVDDPRVAASIAKRSGDPLAESECGRRSPCDLAYIIFTSGSTGRPKGVAVSNRAIALQVQAVTREVPMEPGEAALGIFTIAFDVATLDIFLTLSQGASFLLLDEQEFRDPELIVRSAIRNRAVTMNATPTLWRTLNVDLLPPGVVAMCGGEQFPADLLPRLSRLRRVINLYGPTETAVTATLQRVTEADVQDGIIPVGRPLAGYRVWVLDADNRPVPVGAVGELWIGGAGLAEGYAGDPGLTAERFIACPFAPGRMYRTGDLARWRADGAVEILGRSDAQVKIHGHRIELGEIEQAIRALPWAADAAVVPVGSGSTMRLTAYVVAKPGHTAPDSAGLRSALAERLPEVMRPSACMALEALPRTPSGKLDRGNLPALVEESPIHDYRPPGSAEEALLRLGFARVTGRTRVAGDDDFFEIGGDSLRAMILVSEMRQAGFSLPMQLLFSARSPAAIAESWRGANTKRSVPDMRPLVFMLPGAGGDHPGLAKLRANCSDSVQFVPLEYPDWPTFAGPDASMDDAAAELAARIESIAPTGPICLAGYSFGAYVAWRIAEMFVEKGRIVRGLILLDADAWVRNPPDAPRDPFFTRLNRFVRMRLQSWRDGELSQGLAENLSWHLTHGRGITVLRSLRHVRMLPLPQAFRTWLRFYVSRELHARVVIPWYPGWCDGRPVTALYPVILLRAEEPVRDRAEDLGWGRYFLDLRITEVTGDHLTMLDRSGPRSLQERLPAAVAMLHLNAAQQPGETIPV
jgi:amino acid adenylation domain-containing protein